jgi:RNA polymerase sigma-70 factor (ECF subfamily)
LRDFSIVRGSGSHLADVDYATVQPCSATGLDEMPTVSTQAVDARRLKTAMRDHLRMVWRVLRRCGLEPRDADEAAQDVFLVLSRKMENVVLEAQKSFLVQTALRVASDRRRAIRRFPEVELDPEARSPLAAVDETVALRHARALLDEALATLSGEQRAAFIVVEMEQMTIPEAADMLAVPVGTVASRLRSARQNFAGAIRRIHARERGNLR